MDKDHMVHNSSNVKHHHDNMDHTSKNDNISMNHTHQDHTVHHKMMMKDFKTRFIISLIISIPILLLSPLIQDFFGFNISFSTSNYVLFFLASFVFFYGGWPFIKGLATELKNKSPGMMTLIAVAISVAYFYSSAVVFGLKGKFFFWELATLIDIMLLGHWIEMRSVLGASDALEKLAKLMPDTAHLIKEDKVIDVQLSDITKGNHLLIKPGEKIPSDGAIIKGNSYVNEAFLTGESKPIKKIQGDDVIGGAINGDGSLEIIVESTGDDSYLSKVITLVREAQEAKSKTQRFADRAALWLTIIALTAGLTTLLVWLYYGQDFEFSVERMVTVMVITCPHALGLAIPLVVAVSTALSARNGLLIRNRTAFENARKITTIVFDKTGTLTEGEFGVNSIISADEDFDEKRIIQFAASLEQHSEHPIASGIIKKAKKLDISLLDVSEFKAIKGMGVEGRINDAIVRVVSPGYLTDHDIDLPGSVKINESGTMVFLLINEKIKGSISLSDEIRKESYDAIKRLKKAEVKCWMLTGDNNEIAKKVSNELHLDGYFAEVLPHEKQEKIKELQSKGEFVAMTGDGVNDAPALAQANVGIAVGSGTDVAAETADIILVNSNPVDVTSLILFGRATYRKMKQNLLWATGYNVVAIPLAAGVLYNQGIILSPAVGAVLMSLSTVIVAVNARLLRVEKEI